MAKIAALGPDASGQLHVLTPASVVAVSARSGGLTILTLVSGREVLTDMPLEKITNWLGWTTPVPEPEAKTFECSVCWDQGAYSQDGKRKICDCPAGQ
jgi:hypothetical protein